MRRVFGRVTHETRRTMKFKKLGVATAVGAALAAGAGPAHALEQAMAQSLMNVTNFIIFGADGVTPLSVADFTSFSYLDSLTNTGNLDGTFNGKTKSQSGSSASPPVFVSKVDAPIACTGPGCGSGFATENNFAVAPTPPTSLYSRGD